MQAQRDAPSSATPAERVSSTAGAPPSTAATVNAVHELATLLETVRVVAPSGAGGGRVDPQREFGAACEACCSPVLPWSDKTIRAFTPSPSSHPRVWTVVRCKYQWCVASRRRLGSWHALERGVPLCLPCLPTPPPPQAVIDAGVSPDALAEVVSALSKVRAAQEGGGR